MNGWYPIETCPKGAYVINSKFEPDGWRPFPKTEKPKVKRPVRFLMRDGSDPHFCPGFVEGVSRSKTEMTFIVPEETGFGSLGPKAVSEIRFREIEGISDMIGFRLFVEVLDEEAEDTHRGCGDG